MSFSRALGFHTAILALSGVAAIWVFTREKTPRVVQESEATVWSGRAADVQRVVYEGKNKKVVIEPRGEKKDEPWYLITLERTTTLPPAAPDAGAPAPTKTTTTLVSNAAGKKLFGALAPLRATRSIGKVAGEKAVEYGLDKKETSIVVTIAGREHGLSVGDNAPGGSDSYVLDSGSGEAFVVKADFVRDLDMADSRLMERELHAWKDADAKSATVIAGGKKREIVRSGPETRRFWADPGNRDKADETVGNWIQKVDRLRPSEYVATTPDKLTTVVRIEYAGAAPLGFFELAKTPDPAQAGKFIYYLTSERTHLYAKAVPSLAEQVEQDLGSIVK
jgi:hypothetical protein